MSIISNRGDKKIPKNFFEKKAWAQKMVVCGIDEVGRGCLAGPVVVAAVILPHKTTYILKDSKILTEQEREEAYGWITAHCLYSTASMSHTCVDNLTIYQATQLAMKKAYLQLIEFLPYDISRIKYLVIDAMPVSFDKAYVHKAFETYSFSYGESVSSSIAAASIVAKVTRDRLMKSFSRYFPLFSFDAHKGYGTKVHVRAIALHGQSLIHRKSFILKTKESEQSDECQQTLF